MSAPDSSETSQTDWARLAAESDDDIDYSDIPPLDEDFFRDATLRLPRESQETVTLRLDRIFAALEPAELDRATSQDACIIIGYRLHNLYNAFESIFRNIAQAFETNSTSAPAGTSSC